MADRLKKADRLKNKIAIVTAAGQGIGKATALKLASENAQVYATDINENLLQELKRDNITIEKLDVTNNNEITAFAKQFDKVDILFNCAGFVHNGNIMDCDENDWEFSCNLNLKSMFMMIRAFLPMMRKHQSGSIINMSSVASSIKGVPNRFVYSVTKAGVIGMTKSIAIDFIKEGVRCNAICPGTVFSPSWEQRVANAPDPEKAKKDFFARQPMGRIGKPEEIAELVFYLASDESSYITGQAHIIDGGWSV